MIDLHNKTDRGRLLKAIDTSRQALRPFRQTRMELIRDYVGSWYSTRGARYETLVNLMNQTARTYSRMLAANNPRVKVSAVKPELWPFAKRFEVSINKLVEDMQLDQTFRLSVLDAFFCMGTVKVCMADRGQLEIEQDVWYDPGQPWVGRVSLDDLILDTSAKELSKMRFSGDRYRVSFDKVKGESSYDSKVVKQLTPSTKSSAKNSEEMTRDIQAGVTVDDDELEPMIWLQDVWLPGNGQVATLACDVDLPPLVVRDWTGSQGGPYKYLCLGYVPDNVIPSSPASNLKGLHDLVNRNQRKLRMMADAQRENPTYTPGGEDDANRVRKAKHGEYIKVRDPQSMGTIKVGGIDQTLAAFNIGLTDLYDRMAGNLKAAAGLGAEAATLGQEQIIQGNVSSQMADLQSQVITFAADVCYDLGQLMWSDQFLEVRASREIGRSGERVDSSWTPDRRDGKFEEYDFRVEPYSMVYQTPRQKLQEFFSVLDKLSPMWPMLQATGVGIDGGEVVDYIADMLDRPEFKRILTVLPPQPQGQELGGDQNTIRQSPITSRETIRRNIPTGGTADSRSMVMQQALLGGGSNNPQQTASMARSPA